MSGGEKPSQSKHDGARLAATDDRAHEFVEMPAPTVWPLVMAAGITLSAAGLVTNWAISAFGAVALIGGLAGWIRELVTSAGEIELAWVPAEERARGILPSSARVEALRPGLPGHRMRVPEKVHPYSAGARGGLVGGAAMAVTALAYGVLSGRGIWYPINLLAAMILTNFGEKTPAELQRFSLSALIIATLIHGAASLGLGLCYGIILPTLPRWPMLWGGLVAPLLWTGATYGFMGVLNPVMNELVDWNWFFLSQFVFGITTGAVVARSEKVPSERPRARSPAQQAQDRRY